VLIGLGWLAQPNVDRRLAGRVPVLGRCVSVESAKTAAALTALQRWAEGQGLTAWDTDYGDRRFTSDGDADAERIFRARWARSDQPAPELPRQRTDHRPAGATPELGTAFTPH
jgi:hypothetical protein